MKILDGKNIANDIFDEIKIEVSQLYKSKFKKPHLVAILVGNNGASQTYVNAKVKACEYVGFKSTLIHLEDSISEYDLLSKINEINKNNSIDGLIVQLPLPDHISEKKVTESISPSKDVDGFHPENAGLLSIGKPRFIPCTPKGIMEIFKYYKIKLDGKHVVVVGRSSIVGRPISILTSLKGENSNGTTTICHSGTKDIGKHTKSGDVVIVALGVTGFLKENMIKEGAIVIDVGINRVDDMSERGYRLVGDADWEGINKKAAAITPVPGGVGPMTIAMLVQNTVDAAEYQK